MSSSVVATAVAAAVGFLTGGSFEAPARVGAAPPAPEGGEGEAAAVAAWRVQRRRRRQRAKIGTAEVLLPWSFILFLEGG